MFTVFFLTLEMIGCRTLQLKPGKSSILSVSFTVDQFVLKEQEHPQQSCQLTKDHYEENQVGQKIPLSVSLYTLSHVLERRNKNRDTKIISQIGSINRGIRATILQTAADIYLGIEPEALVQCEGGKDEEYPYCSPVHGKLMQQL